MKAMDNMATRGIKYVSVTTPKKASGKLKQIYDQINRDFALAPPFTLHSAVPDLVAAVWSLERETMFHGIVPRGHKEAVVAAVAIINECPYCIDAHTLMMQASDESEAVKALSSNGGRIADAELQRLVDWAKATRTPDAGILLNPPFSPEAAPEIIGAALAFHYINRMANIYLDDHMMSKMGVVSGLVRNLMASTVIKAMLQRKIVPGASIEFLPEANPPEEFDWASQNEILSRTFAGVTTVINTHARKLFSEKVFDIVCDFIGGWNGEDMGMSRLWLNPVIRDLDEADAVATRLMLLAGLTSYQVTEADIKKFRRIYSDDAALVAATSWGVWTAVQRISTWLKKTEIEAKA